MVGHNGFSPSNDICEVMRSGLYATCWCSRMPACPFMPSSLPPCASAQLRFFLGSGIPSSRVAVAAPWFSPRFMARIVAKSSGANRGANRGTNCGAHLPNEWVEARLTCMAHNMTPRRTTWKMISEFKVIDTQKSKMVSTFKLETHFKPQMKKWTKSTMGRLIQIWQTNPKTNNNEN